MKLKKTVLFKVRIFSQGNNYMQIHVHSNFRTKVISVYDNYELTATAAMLPDNKFY